MDDAAIQYLEKIASEARNASQRLQSLRHFQEQLSNDLRAISIEVDWPSKTHAQNRAAITLAPRFKDAIRSIIEAEVFICEQRLKRLEPAALKEWSPGLEAIRNERERQLRDWSPEHDDEHVRGELAVTAACLAASGTNCGGRFEAATGSYLCSLDLADASKTDRLKQLAAAGALVVAEIERIQRARASASDAEGGDA